MFWEASAALCDIFSFYLFVSAPLEKEESSWQLQSQTLIIKTKFRLSLHPTPALLCECPVTHFGTAKSWAAFPSLVQTMDTQWDRINGQVENWCFLTLKCLILPFSPNVFWMFFSLSVSVVTDFRISSYLDLKRGISASGSFSEVTGFIRDEFGPLHLMNCIFQNQY